MITGLLVPSFPIVLGCDASGVVVEVGSGEEKEEEDEGTGSLFKVGDRVCGCVRLGEPGYGTFQEYVRIEYTHSIIYSKYMGFAFFYFLFSFLFFSFPPFPFLSRYTTCIISLHTQSLMNRNPTFWERWGDIVSHGCQTGHTSSEKTFL